jgi:hypothetical protein
MDPDCRVLFSVETYPAVTTIPNDRRHCGSSKCRYLPVETALWEKLGDLNLRAEILCTSTLLDQL